MHLLLTVLFCSLVGGAPSERVLESWPAPGPAPYGLAWDGTQWWHADSQTQTLYAFAGDTHAIVAEISLARELRGVADAGEALWLTWAPNQVGRFLKAERTFDRTFVCPEVERIGGIAFDGQRLFVAATGAGQVHVLDPATGQPLGTIPTPGRYPRGLTGREGWLWVVDSVDRTAYEISPDTGQRRRSLFLSPGHNRGIAWVGNRLYYSEQTVPGLYELEFEEHEHFIRSFRRRFRIRYQHWCTNRSPQPLPRITFYLAVPQSTPKQRIYRLTWLTEPRETFSDPYGQPLAKVVVENLAPGETARAGWEVEAEVWGIRYNLPEEGFAPLSEVPADIRKLYCADGTRLQLDHPTIQAAAAEVPPAENPCQLVLNLRNAIYARLQYERDNRWLPAPEVWAQGKGSCSEYSFVFAALARRLGIPTRFVGGTRFRGKMDERRARDDVFHRWVEVYLPPYGWLPLDASADDNKEGRHFCRRNFLATGCDLFELSRTGGGARPGLGWDYRSAQVIEWGDLPPEQRKVEGDEVAEWGLIGSD